MENFELVKNFIENANSFYDDLKSNKYDAKHNEIVTNAYKEIENDENSFSVNFRSWAMQSDLTVPMQIKSYGIAKYGAINFITKYLYRKIFRQKEEVEIRNSFFDDNMLENV